MSKFTLLFCCLALFSYKLNAQTTIISFGSDNWKYLDNGTNQGTAWRATSFDDTGWKTGRSKFGYGINDAITTVSFGANTKKKYITTYFRKTVSIAASYTSYTAKVKRDDGVVVYLNGIEVYRNNMPTGAVAYTTLAREASDNGKTAQTFTISASAFTSGTNVIAVEVHQAKENTPDMAFDLELIGNAAPPPVENPKVLYYEGFESGTGFAGMHLQSSTTYGFTVVSSPTYHEKKVGRFELRKGDAEASGGTRTEVLFTEALAQETTWHSFAAYFPSVDYVDDTLSYEVYNQWHQGSTWGTPMLVLRIRNGRVYLNRRSNTGSTVQYDLGPQLKDQWMKFVIHLKQHPRDGFMKVWINNVLAISITGETMFPDTDPVPYGRWKMGIYKSDWNNGGTYKPSSTTVRVWYVDEVKIGNAASSYETMEPFGNNISMLAVQASSTQSFLHDDLPTIEAEQDQLSIYPTLVKRGTAIMVRAHTSEPGIVSVSDVTGRILYTSRFSSMTSIETLNLPSGLYFISLADLKQQKKHKFIVTD